MGLLHKEPGISKSLKYLLKHDPVFSRHMFDLGEFKWEQFEPGFEGLARIVVGQQVSTAAARTIWQRVRDGLLDVTPAAIIKARPEKLRGFGLSGQKVAYIKGLAKAVAEGDFDPAAMHGLSNDEISEAITALKGFGPWSAQMFLMFGLARPDIWAPGDLGIQAGLQHYLNLPDRPDHAMTMKYGERFSTHQTAASLLLWHINGKGGLPE
jgi:DNA-3-methyladenine glycosylase II